jgi:hypothetical protein
VDTAEDFSVRFDAVADDTAVAVGANRRQRVNCALEAIKGVAFSAHDDFKRLVIIVLADFACRHTQFGSRERRSVAVFCLDRERDSLAAPAGIIDAGYRFALWKFFWS